MRLSELLKSTCPFIVTVTLDLRTSYGDLQAGAELREMMVMQDNGKEHVAFVAGFVIRVSVLYTIVQGMVNGKHK